MAGSNKTPRESSAHKEATSEVCSLQKKLGFFDQRKRGNLSLSANWGLVTKGKTGVIYYIYRRIDSVEGNTGLVPQI